MDAKTNPALVLLNAEVKEKEAEIDFERDNLVRLNDKLTATNTKLNELMAERDALAQAIQTLSAPEKPAPGVNFQTLAQCYSQMPEYRHQDGNAIKAGRVRTVEPHGPSVRVTLVSDVDQRNTAVVHISAEWAHEFRLNTGDMLAYYPKENGLAVWDIESFHSEHSPTEEAQEVPAEPTPQEVMADLFDALPRYVRSGWTFHAGRIVNREIRPGGTQRVTLSSPDNTLPLFVCDIPPKDCFVGGILVRADDDGRLACYSRGFFAGEFAPDCQAPSDFRISAIETLSKAQAWGRRGGYVVRAGRINNIAIEQDPPRHVFTVQPESRAPSLQVTLPPAFSDEQRPKIGGYLVLEPTKAITFWPVDAFLNEHHANPSHA
ncbi:MAG: hypothetical protein CMJ75_19035 [Planctomycetaceae bacterium]|nr:hypothetical protein [Planctomycetaceae bacterium]